MNIADLLRAGQARLNNRLEAEVLLGFLLKKDRSFLYTWPNQVLSQEICQQFFALIERRVAGEPIAYILGEKEFWSLPFNVSPAVLIPRPETECLVETILKLYKEYKELSAQPSSETSAAKTLRVLELGTGSGAIALSLGHERPEWEIIATDISEAALQVAKANAAHLNVKNVRFYQGNWFQAIADLPPQQKIFDIVVSNPPYIDPNDPHLHQGDLKFEPSLALISEDQGLADLKKIISEAPHYLSRGGCLIVEQGHTQKDAVVELMKYKKLLKISVIFDQSGLPRVILGFKD